MTKKNKKKLFESKQVLNMMEMAGYSEDTRKSHLTKLKESYGYEDDMNEEMDMEDELEGGEEGSEDPVDAPVETDPVVDEPVDAPVDSMGGGDEETAKKVIMAVADALGVDLEIEGEGDELDADLGGEVGGDMGGELGDEEDFEAALEEAERMVREHMSQNEKKKNRIRESKRGQIEEIVRKVLAEQE